MSETANDSPTPDPQQDAMCPMLDPCITFSDRTYGGVSSYVVHHPLRGKYFRIGGEEYYLISGLDGYRTVAEIGEQARQDGVDWSDEKIAELFALLSKNGIVIANAEQTPDSPPSSDPGQPIPWHQPLLKLLSLTISQRIPLLDGNRFASAFVGPIGWCFSTKGILLWLLLVGSGLSIVMNNSEFAGELFRVFDPGIWPLLIAIWCVSKLLHELGHAVCAKYRGVKVGRAGVMFFLFAPLAYVDVTDAWKLQRRRYRMQIALAGVYLELAMAAAAAWAWWYLPTGYLKHLAAQIFVVAGPATLLINANPLLRLDGYYLLSDLLEIPNLRMHGRRQLGARIESVLLSIPSKESLLTGWRRSFATFHAFCSVIFQFFWMGGLVFAVATWAGGLGAVLAVCAALMWAVLPLSRWIWKVWRLEPGGVLWMNRPRGRLVGIATLIIALVYQVSFQSSPLARRVPVVVRHTDEQISRASSDAFVDKVFVTRGQRVFKGMVLLQLRQPELTLKREQRADDRELALLKSIQFRQQGRIAEAQGEEEAMKSLDSQLAEIDAQLSELQIVAERDGLVTSAHTEHLVGTFVSQGDELVRVADPNDKELLVSISENDVEAYEGALGNMALVRLRGGTCLDAVPKLLKPRARTTPSHPALAANVGGPLAVEPGDEPDQMELVTPQFESTVELDAGISVHLRAGQIGMMAIDDNRSMLRRILDVAMAKPQG